MSKGVTGDAEELTSGCSGILGAVYPVLVKAGSCDVCMTKPGKDLGCCRYAPDKRENKI